MPADYRTARSFGFWKRLQIANCKLQIAGGAEIPAVARGLRANEIFDFDRLACHSGLIITKTRSEAVARPNVNVTYRPLTNQSPDAVGPFNFGTPRDCSQAEPGRPCEGKLRSKIPGQLCRRRNLKGQKARSGKRESQIGPFTGNFSLQRLFGANLTRRENE